jgi:hypothetical protein
MTTPPPLPPDGGPAWTGTPWERREQIGFFPALVETTQQVLMGPEAFFRGMAVAGGITAPLLYGVIIGYVGIVASTLYSLVFNMAFGGFGALARQGGAFERLAPFLEGGANLFVNLIFGPVFIAVGLFIWSGIVHVVLMVLGGAQREFEATFRVMSYSQAASILQIVPICGSVAAVVYSIILEIIGLSHAHGISKGKAAAAVLLPILLVCCCCGLAFAILFGSLAGVISQMK